MRLLAGTQTPTRCSRYALTAGGPPAVPVKSLFWLHYRAGLVKATESLSKIVTAQIYGSSLDRLFNLITKELPGDEKILFWNTPFKLGLACLRRGSEAPKIRE